MWLTVHTQQHNPHKILTLLLQHGSISEIGQKIRVELANPNITTSQHPLSPKNLRSSHKTIGILLRIKYIPYPIQKSIETSSMSCHTTTPKILDTFILSLMLVLTETHATTLNLFLTFLTHQKFSR